MIAITAGPHQFTARFEDAAPKTAARPRDLTPYADKLGQIAGNDFMMATGGRENLAAMGRVVLWQEAQDIRSAMEG